MAIAPGGMISAFLAFGLFPAASAQEEEWKPSPAVMGHRCVAEDMARLKAVVDAGDDLVDVREEPGRGLSARGVVTKDGFDINLPAHRARWLDRGAPSKGGNALCPGYIWNFISPPGKVMRFGPSEKDSKTWVELKIAEQLVYIRQAEANFDDVDQKTEVFLKAAIGFYDNLVDVGLLALKTNAPFEIGSVKSKFNLPIFGFRKPDLSAIAQMDEEKFKSLWEAMAKVIVAEKAPELKEASRKAFDAMAVLHSSAQEIFKTLRSHGVTKNENKVEFVEAEAKLYMGEEHAKAAVHQIAAKAVPDHSAVLKLGPVVGIYDPHLSHAVDFHFHEIVQFIEEVGKLERELKKPAIKLGERAKDIMGSK